MAENGIDNKKCMSESIEKKKVSFKKPKWLRVKLPIGPEYKKAVPYTHLTLPPHPYG